MGIQVKLSHIELEGFKSFRDRTVIGPLGGFTCIVGPNGCGKSVVGEAIAFALGGNRKMLRSGSLADLLNQERRAAGCRTAQVTLRLELMHEGPAVASGTHVTAVPASHSTAATPAVNVATIDAAATATATDPASMFSPNAAALNLEDVSMQDSQVEGLQDQATAMAATQRAAAEVQAPMPPQWLGVRRILRGDMSKTLIKQPDSNAWVQVNQTELQHELAAYNIHTKGVDRYIVAQSRQAVNVGDPVGLVKNVECLTGTGDYESRIQEQSNMIEQLAANIDETQQQIASLEYKREQLAPHVAHWQLVQQQQAELLSSRVQLLQEQQQHSSMLMQQLQHQVDSAEASATEAAKGAALLTAQQMAMQQQEADITQQLQASRQKEQALRKKVSRLTAAAAASKVQLSCSATALKSQQVLAQKLQEKLANLHAEEAQHKGHIAEVHLQLRQLQETESAAERQLNAVRRSAVAEGAQQQSLLYGSKLQGKAVGHAGAAAAATTAESADRSAAVSHQIQALQQQLEAADAAVGVARLLESTAADRATRAAISLQGYQSSKAAAETTIMTARQQWQQAVAAAQAAAEGFVAGQSAMQGAEQQWRKAILEERHLQEQIQAAQAEQQQWQQELNHPGQLHNRSGSTAASSACDRAVQQLKQQSDLQQLPGVFYGRLCNILSVVDASAAVAVNSALAEIANLNSTLIVSSRQAAAAAIDHFRRNKIGTVQCKILSEISARTADSYAGNSGSSGCRALLEFVTAVPGVPGLQQLQQQLLGNWLLVEDRQTASTLLHLRRNVVTRIGEVFKADGEVVVNMGSSSRNNNSNSYSASSTTAYSLKVGQAEAIAPPDGAAAAGSSAIEQKAAAVAAAAAAKAAQQRVFELQEQLFAASRAAAATHAQLQAARDACCKQQQQVAAAQRHEQRMCSQYQAEEAKAAHLLPQLQQQIDTSLKEQQKATTAAADATAAVQRAVIKQQQLEQLLQQQIEVDGSSSGSGSSTRAAAVTAAAKSKEAIQQAEAAYATAAAAVTAAWADADRVKSLQKRAATKAASAAKELAKVQATGHKQQELQQLQAKQDAEQQQQLAAVQSGLEAILAERADLGSTLKSVQKQLAAASKAADAASQEANAKMMLLQQHLATLQDLQLQQQQRNTALQEVLKQQHMQPPDTTPVGTAAPAAPAEAAATEPAAIIGSRDDVELYVYMADAVGTEQQTTTHQQQQQQQRFDLAVEMQQADPVTVRVQGGNLRSRKQAAKQQQQQQQQRNRQQAKQGGKSARGRRVLIDSSSSSSSEGADCKDGQSTSSDDDSGTQDPQHSRPPGKTTAAAAAAAKRKKRCQQQQQQEAALPSAAALAKQGQQLQMRQQQLDDQQHALQQQLAKVNESALEQDVKALQDLVAAHAALRQLEQQHDEAAMTQERLLDERYNKLLEVLQALNSHLDGTYRQLTGGCGSAYCAYTEERRLLFSQGVTLHVQPDGVAWRQFSMLSGGQQALAALALSFALQALFPSPFYFFDEVDCALDSLAAGRVAAYVKAQCSKSPSSISSSSACGGVGTGLTDALAVATKGAMSVSSSSAESSHPAAAAAEAETAALGRRGAQYLLVSHRPVVFESAGCLLGVYSNGCGSSSAIVAHF